jgi:hypothetical protein
VLLRLLQNGELESDYFDAAKGTAIDGIVTTGGRKAEAALREFHQERRLNFETLAEHHMHRLQYTFGFLIIMQAAHSLEEFFGRLWESFPPAAFITSLVSSNGEAGFLIINAAFIAFGIWCFQWPVRRGWSSAEPIIWSWVVVEAVNGAGHLTWTFIQGQYTPGVATAPVLLGLCLYLAGQLRNKPKASAGARNAASHPFI